MSSSLLSTLNPEQQAVVQATHGPVLVLAGAGSGKTRALTHRIAYLLDQRLAHPDEILAVTFTNKAAWEMRERVARLVGSTERTPGALGTFHALGARILREQARHTNRSVSFTIADTADSEQLLKAAFKELAISPKEWQPQTIRHAISRTKNALQTPADAATYAESALDEVVARTYARYQALLVQNDAYDFDDLLMAAISVLHAQPAVRAAYQQRWRYLSVDEYQDTNPAQEQLLQLLLGPERNLCVVGDDYQAIYSWRGARVDHILHFAATYPGCTTLYLTQNYRSTPPILTAAHQVIAANREQQHKQLWTTVDGGVPVRVVSLPSDRAEANWIRQAIQTHLQQGGRARDCVILYRTNAQSRAFEEQFITWQMPYAVVGGFRFYDRREVKDAIALLQLWVNPRSGLALGRLARAYLDGIGPQTLRRLERTAQDQASSLLDVITQGSELTDRQRASLAPLAAAYRQAQAHPPDTVAELLRLLVEASGYARALKAEADGEERWENIEELLTVALGYREAVEFVEAVALMSDIDEADTTSDRITCMTLHAAKGLEFTHVFVVGCEEGLLPHRNSLDNPAQLAEERRLLYVGMTRAQQSLTLTHAATRLLHGELLPQAPSRFLESLPAEVVHDRVDSPAFAAVPSPAAPLTAPGEPVTVTAEVGDFVQHPVFGRGVVVAATGQLLTCVFEGYGVKTIDGIFVTSNQ